MALTPHGSRVLARIGHATATFVVVVLTLGTAPAPAGAPPPGPDQADTATYRPIPTSVRGFPGTPVDVAFPRGAGTSSYDGCAAALDDHWVDCLDRDGWHAVLPVSLSARPGTLTLKWRTWKKSAADPRKPTTVAEGDFAFEVLAPEFDVRATPRTAKPGEPIDVEFRSLAPGVKITGCGAGFGGDITRCTVSAGPERKVRVILPETGATTAERDLTWNLTYTGPSKGARGVAKDRIPIRILLAPPEFSVLPGSTTVGPGSPVTVQFTSLTTGVRITGCRITYVSSASCSKSGLAVLTVPGDAKPDTTIPLDWELTFDSTRPGEKPGTRADRLEVTVVVGQPDIAVTVQPAAARPGETVTLAFTSLVAGNDIVNCIAFFPRDPGGTCRRSPQRWFARTKVPADAQPGATLLRWGVASVTAAGRRGADDGVIPYTVLPVRSTVATTLPTKVADPVVPTTGEFGALPEFVAVTDPEAALPGRRITVTVSPRDGRAEITGCTIAFAGQADRLCGRSGGRWSATVRVPDNAPAGDLPLAWRVQARDSGGAKLTGYGTIAYQVLNPAAPAPPPAFAVLPEPAAARAGTEVAVSQTSLVEGVAITACSAGFADGVMTPCRPDGNGWVADVKVPDAMPAGPGTVLWKVAYARPGEAGGTTDGLLSFRVLPGSGETASGWHKARDLAWRVLVSALLLAGLLLFKSVRRVLRRWWGSPSSITADTGDGVEDTGPPRVVPVVPPGPLDVRVDQPDALPRRLVRVRIHEEVP